jgi:hypothetical protein
MQRVCKFLCDRDDLLQFIVLQHERREDAGTVAGMDARLFDMFHHAADEHIVAVADRIHIEFERIFQEAVDEDRFFRRDIHREFHVFLE